MDKRAKTAEMRQDSATTREPVGQSRIETLMQEIVRIHGDAYYALRRSQPDQERREGSEGVSYQGSSDEGGTGCTEGNLAVRESSLGI